MHLVRACESQCRTQPYQMPVGYKVDKMGEIVFANVEELSVSDVYDLACEIGKECEVLITTVGTDQVNPLIKKILITLELLEIFATRNEQESSTMAEMALRIERLELEKEQRTENRHRFEKDIETVEEQWRGELNRLLEENRRLVQESKESSSSNSADTSSKTATSGELVAAELENMQKVFRQEMKRREDDLNSQQEEVVNLQLQMEALKATNVDAKRFQRELQGQIRALVNERTNCMTRIQDQHSEIVALKRQPTHSAVGESSAAKSTPQVVEESAKVEEVSGGHSDEDAPVQGPMPYEPDDAPWKRPARRDSESGIRKFFRQLFLENDSGPFGHRTFESLSKMGSSSAGV